MSNFYETLKVVLLQDDRLVAQDGTLLRNRAFELGAQMDVLLIRLLLNHSATKKHFFTQVDDVQIFDKREFCYVVNNRQFWPDSYTRFTNKIGLTDASENFLAQTEDVQLLWPYKECLLEGGQTKDEQTRSEIFWNQLLAPDECDRLLAPKVFVGAKRYTPDGTETTDTFDVTTDNLLIKGNNLLAISSLLPVYEGKVKLIYIDPPYNTGSDSFGYNDRFNHSAWLTFMKNRLEIARRLLRKDGSIWIQADDNEAHYLKVLADEIFGRENFVANVVWEKKFAPQNDTKWLSDSHDHIIVFAVNKNLWRPCLLDRTEEMDARYSNPDNDPRGDWTSGDLSVKTYSAEYDYPIITPAGREVVPPQGRCWRTSQTKLKELVTDNRIWFGENGGNVPRIKRFLTEVKQGAVSKTLWMRTDVSDNDAAAKEIGKLFDTNLFSTPKPERLLQRIIHLGSHPGDLVVDFFAGSGTTLAGAHKMGRRFIGIEQMDYIETITAERLKKVIGRRAECVQRASDVSRRVEPEGDTITTRQLTLAARYVDAKLSAEFEELEYDTGGISKAVNWNGGGSCELAALNATFIDRIEKVKQDQPTELDLLWEEIKASGFISYLVDPQTANEDFYNGTLSFAEKKRFLVDVLDKNLLYVNYCDMNDAEYTISESDKKFTKAFYGK